MSESEIMKLTTHRVIQLSELSDSLKVLADQCARASVNAASIRNFTMAKRFAGQARRARQIRTRVAIRLGNDCPHQMDIDVERRPGNALNVEIGAPLPRCNRKSPDGRGLVWLMSGGSPLAYGNCTPLHCPTL